MTLRALVVCLAAAATIAAATIATLVAAEAPPVPDFYWPYGTVQVEGTNISPTVQPIIAFVNGRSCGQSASTSFVEDNSDSPPVDAGKTVYVVNVLADGTGPGQRVGCGTAGAPVTFYFPVVGRIASQQPLFKAGGERVNLTLDVSLSNRMLAPFAAADSAP
jgi:hypothetical protein